MPSSVWAGAAAAVASIAGAATTSAERRASFLKILNTDVRCCTPFRAAVQAHKRILLEGRPGSGKTTAVARLVDLLRAEGVAVSGFFTRELREGGERVGFALIWLGLSSVGRCDRPG
ncbi:MAG TPA: nucleoside-triphosphatase [Methylomirabilota bacterium]|nr:nucleoside-triphosphatase [Methylomirabilota bacterium]